MPLATDDARQREEHAMSYPYPQDRHRDRREKGEQPYKDAREAMSEQEAQIQAEAEAFGESRPRPGDEGYIEDLETAAEERFKEINASRERGE
jgi:hypothetical protein